MIWKIVVLGLVGGAVCALAQEVTQPQDAPPKGTVLIQSHGEPPSVGGAPPISQDARDPSARSGQATGQPDGATPVSTAVQKASGPEFTDVQRGALTFTGYDLDVRLRPVTSGLAMRARVTVRNDGDAALGRVALQISSSLKWESVTQVAGAKRTRLELVQHALDTDADHAGSVSELLVTLPEALVPGASVTLDTFYSGTVEQSAERLERIGAKPAQSASADWDAVGPAGVALRGFGDVLWYPVAAPQLFLGDGAKLFQAVGKTKLRDERALIRLRVAVEYRGEPPVAVYFCGRRQPLVALNDDANAPVATGTGVASAEFAAEPLGFRVPSLFVVEEPETVLANQMLAVEAKDDSSVPLLGTSAERVAPLLQKWFGARPLSALTVIDHAGQPFEDGPLLVAPVAALAVSTANETLVHTMTHAWVQTGQPWMDEGLAQFAGLLWTEQEDGREAAMRELQDLMQPLALIEPVIRATGAASDLPDANEGQPLIVSSEEVYYRRKSAAVWWMLRGLTSDDALRQALSAWVTQPVSTASAREQALGFEALLEKTSGKDLAWFFHDWVLNDEGLPDLTIADVTPRFLPIGAGHNSGWLVAVTVRNDGAAAVEVPVSIQSRDGSATFSTTKPLRIPGFGSATARVLVEAPPTEVKVNDGGTPEVRSSLHTRNVVVKTE